MLVEIVDVDNTEIVDLYFAPDGKIYKDKTTYVLKPTCKIKVNNEIVEYQLDDIAYLCYAI